jgi:hypothetical protein
VRTSDGETKAIVTAMFAVQTGMKAALKDAKNPAFKSTYADLGSVWEACRDALKAAKVLVSQDVTSDDCGVSISTRFTHESTQWMEFGPLYIPLAKKDAQAVGSAVSYGRRYSLSAALGVIAEDDDGQAAVASAPAPQPRYEAKPATNGKAVAKAADAVPERKLVAVITADQRKQLQKDAEVAGWSVEEVKKMLAGFGFKSSADITEDIYSTISRTIHEGTGGADSAPF